ncbi:hypothetical protein JZ751_011830 [Albula glossodonta]|uniref:Fatty acid hydroxylase domain-containing protein n=1 Tax=Albula glossodonta TaxID=121402 RepID=A0A8T2PQW2_9TELE|nr:hypothetical protein JZ751_011830 [Albula glossodonta]
MLLTPMPRVAYYMSPHITKRRPVARGSVTKRRPVARGSVTKRRPVARGSVTKRRPVARGSVTKRRPVARGSVTKRRPVARGSVTKRRPVARGGVTKRRPVARGSVTKRRPVARGSVTKRRPVARGSVTKRRPVARGSVTKRRFRLRRQVYRKISSSITKRRRVARGSVTKRRPVARGSITKRRRVARGSVTKRRPVARGSVTKRRPVARGSVTKRRPVARGSVTKRRPVARGSVTKRRPVARGSVTKRRPVARGSVTKRRPVARGRVTKRRPVAGSVTKRRFRLRRQVYRKISSRVSWINKYRIHSDRPVKLQSVLKAVGLTLHNHVVFVFPASIAQWYWRPPLPLEEAAPTVTEFTLGILGCLLLFDFQYYLWHLAHHRSQWLYVTFHAIHHEYPQPFCWVTQYMSAWELVSVGFWTTVDPVLLRCHTLTGYAFMVFNIWVSVDDHSGYDFPWSLHNLVPFGLWGGSVKHDTHHQRPKTNFQPFFSHWDWLCGTSSQHCHSPAMVAKVRRTVSHQPTNPEDRRSVTEAETSLHALAAVLIADSIRVDARVGEEIVTIQPLNDRLSAALRLST